MKLFVVFLLIMTSQAYACEADLLFLLSEARHSVVNHFAKGEPCYKAALVGRTQGAPGCYPPAAFQLQGLLKPLFKRATAVCQQSCRSEGKTRSCQKLIDQDYLKKVGIDQLIRSLKTSGLATDAIYWDSLDSEDTLEI